MLRRGRRAGEAGHHGRSAPARHEPALAADLLFHVGAPVAPSAAISGDGDCLRSGLNLGPVIEYLGILFEWANRESQHDANTSG